MLNNDRGLFTELKGGHIIPSNTVPNIDYLILGAEISHVVIVKIQKYDVKLQKKFHTAECLLQGSVIFLRIIIYLFYRLLIFTSFNTPNALHISELQYTYTINLSTFTITPVELGKTNDFLVKSFQKNEKKLPLHVKYLPSLPSFPNY